MALLFHQTRLAKQKTNSPLLFLFLILICAFYNGQALPAASYIWGSAGGKNENSSSLRHNKRCDGSTSLRFQVSCSRRGARAVSNVPQGPSMHNIHSHTSSSSSRDDSRLERVAKNAHNRRAVRDDAFKNSLCWQVPQLHDAVCVPNRHDSRHLTRSHGAGCRIPNAKHARWVGADVATATTSRLYGLLDRVDHRAIVVDLKQCFTSVIQKIHHVTVADESSCKWPHLALF